MEPMGKEEKSDRYDYFPSVGFIYRSGKSLRDLTLVTYDSGLTGAGTVLGFLSLCQLSQFCHFQLLEKELASLSWKKTRTKARQLQARGFHLSALRSWLTRARGDCEVQVRPAYLSLINTVDWPGIMAHTCYPSDQKAQAGRLRIPGQLSQSNVLSPTVATTK